MSPPRPLATVPATAQIEVHVVYCGPGLCGKTTNVKQIVKAVPKEERGELISLDTENERTLVFDLLPVSLHRPGLERARLFLETVPGQVYYEETRHRLLQRADALVFVADSAPGRIEANEHALFDLWEALARQDRDAASMPLVIQYNKRDLPDRLPWEVLQQRLNPMGAPNVEAIALEGVGVLPTLRAVVDEVCRIHHAQLEEFAATPA